MRPDGRNALRKLAKETAGSAKNITPKRDTRRSKLAAVERIDRGVRQHEIERQPVGASCRARASIGAEISTPSTKPDGATRSANAIVVAPQPQPTSRIRSPGFAAGAVDQDLRDRRQQRHPAAAAGPSSARPAGPFQNAI